MKRILFAVFLLLGCLSIHAEPVYYGFKELSLDESFVYRFVKAMDAESQKAVEDILAGKNETEDQSIIKRAQDEWYVRKDHLLPDGNYYESAFYRENYGNVNIILPTIEVIIEKDASVDELLGLLGNRVTILGNEENAYYLGCQVKTSEEVLELCLLIYGCAYEYGIHGVKRFKADTYTLNSISDSYLISRLKDSYKTFVPKHEGEVLLYEMDWQGVDYNGGWVDYISADTESYWSAEGTDEGLAITVHTKQGQIWQPQVMVVPDAFPLEAGRNYIVRLTLKVPSDGIYQVNLGSWAANTQYQTPVTASDEWQEIDVDFQQFGLGEGWLNSGDADSRNYLNPCHVLLQCGWMVGTTIVKKVQVYERTTQDTYRPFVEEGKVWKVGDITSGNPVQRVDYYYFDGDTIVDGKTCKQMMRQGYVNPDYAESHNISQDPSLSYVGAWYEKDQKVYFCNATNNQFKLMYDFSLEDNGTFLKNDLPYVYVVGPRQTGGIKGFKGVYRDVLEWQNEKSYRCTPWMEGVGIVWGPPTSNIFNEVLMDPGSFLMECYVGDEVIYFDDECEDGATPDEIAGVRKSRFDFTHTTKTKPKTRSKQEESDARISSSERDVARPKVKTRMRSEEEHSLYGEYNEQQLSINLSPISDAYLVSITDESGKMVYEKPINAGNIVGLNIDISAYAKGHYTVTVENSQESFTGEFETLTNGIKATRINKEGIRTGIYNLQGQRLNSLQKGLNIVNGQKVYVK